MSPKKTLYVYLLLTYLFEGVRIFGYEVVSCVPDDLLGEYGAEEFVYFLERSVVTHGRKHCVGSSHCTYYKR